MKITVDTNFLISATQWDYSVSHKLLNELIKKNAEIFVTDFILEEFSKVLQRDFKYQDEKIEEFVELVLSFSKLIIPKIKIEAVKEDLDDNNIIECALESKSEYILTYDKHLLKIKEYKDVKIVKPEKFLEN
ncbi:putative toxin-antitoxin system toxin component, PIN family [Candidatus Woesearchaeota archaeon]|nr:putative toxin-antitoxin system toxin component, PIN family [Candidatus Woesearchaeota archaeon]